MQSARLAPDTRWYGDVSVFGEKEALSTGSAIAISISYCWANSARTNVLFQDIQQRHRLTVTAG